MIFQIIFAKIRKKSGSVLNFGFIHVYYFNGLK